MGREYFRTISIQGQSNPYGDILFMDDFEYFTRWSFTADGSDYVARRSILKPHTGSIGLELRTRDTNKALSDHVTATCNQVALPASPLRIEFSLWLEDPAYSLYFWLKAAIYDGTNRHWVSIKLDQDTPEWLYGSAYDATYTAFPTQPPIPAYLSWSHWALDFDINTGEYVKFSIDGHETSMAGTTYPTAASAALRGSVLELALIQAGNTAPAQAYVDDFLISTPRD